MDSKKKKTLKEWEQIKEAKMRERIAKRQRRMKEKQELQEEKNEVGLQAWANSLGFLKAGKQLPF